MSAVSTTSFDDDVSKLRNHYGITFPTGNNCPAKMPALQITSRTKQVRSISSGWKTIRFLEVSADV
jgi:hypothetical protein